MKIGTSVNIDIMPTNGFTRTMSDFHIETRPSRGYKKRERTRQQLVTAGTAILAEKGEALTISDVVAVSRVGMRAVMAQPPCEFQNRLRCNSDDGRQRCNSDVLIQCSFVYLL